VEVPDSDMPVADVPEVTAIDSPSIATETNQPVPVPQETGMEY
jgi:hypothetical protein